MVAEDQVVGPRRRGAGAGRADCVSAEEGGGEVWEGGAGVDGAGGGGGGAGVGDG